MSPAGVSRSVAAPAAVEASATVTATAAAAAQTTASSLVGRALDAVLYSTPALGGGAPSTPAIGIQTQSWLTSSEEPLQLGFYSERQSVPLDYMDHLSAQQIGLTAAGRVLGARLYGGAGLERVHTSVFHPDLPSTRRVFDLAGEDYGSPGVTGPAGSYDVDYAPHLTAGAAYDIGALHMGAGASFGLYSSVSLTAQLPLF